MRLLTGAAIAALLLASPALAQTTQAGDPTPVAQPTACAPLPERPTPPDGATANRQQMEAGVAAFNAWAEQYRQGVACRRQEVAQMRATHDALLAQHNQAAQDLNTAIASIEAEAAEFNQRNPGRANTNGMRRRDDERF